MEFGLNEGGSEIQNIGYKEGKGKVHSLPSVTGFKSKIVFNLAEHPHYYSDWDTHCTWPGFEPRTSQFRRNCSPD